MRVPTPILAATASVLLALAVLTSPPAAAQQDETGKWFVLRGPSSTQCWTARLIQVSGQYASGSALIAGGPFDSEEQARQRLAELGDRGTCASA